MTDEQSMNLDEPTADIAADTPHPEGSTTSDEQPAKRRWAWLVSKSRSTTLPRRRALIWAKRYQASRR